MFPIMNKHDLIYAWVPVKIFSLGNSDFPYNNYQMTVFFSYKTPLKILKRALPNRYQNKDKWSFDFAWDILHYSTLYLQAFAFFF